MDGNSPRLIVTSPSGLRGTTLDIVPGRNVVGRAQTSELRLADEHVSRIHAALERGPGQTSIEDLGSSGGTVLNGVPLSGRRPLRHGDVIRFSSVETRYEESGTAGDETVVGTYRPASGSRTAHPAAPAAGRGPTQFNVGRQQSGSFNNVGGDQYNQYINHIQAQRESFFREVAAARTRARRLIVVGLVLFLAGIGLYLWVFGQTAGRFNDIFSDASAGADPSVAGPPDFGNFFGPNVGGMPLAVIAIAVNGLGGILMVVGLVLHIVAAARRKSFDERTRPAPPLAPPTASR
jgi:hypothetical protein